MPIIDCTVWSLVCELISFIFYTVALRGMFLEAKSVEPRYDHLAYSFIVFVICYC